MTQINEELVVPERTSVTYGSYLKINDLLALQSPLTIPAEHDETLFIIIHQVYELWFKQILHEVSLAQTALENDRVAQFLRIAGRISTIQSVLIHQVDVLETMTPVDFNRFRDNLNPASGFQSYQFRVLEYRLGAKEPAYMNFHVHDPVARAAMQAALIEPTLYDRFLQLLSRRGFNIPRDVLQRDVTSPYRESAAVEDVILEIYRSADRFYELYSALEAMLDLDEGILLWRQRHVTMVERMIGNRRGTGGSSGTRYLSATLEKRFFPELWAVRNRLGETEYGSGKVRPSPGSEAEQSHP